MKYIYQLILLCVFLNACKEKDATKGMEGTWVVASIMKADSKFETSKGYQFDELNKDPLFLHVLKFDANNKVWVANADTIAAPYTYQLLDNGLQINQSNGTLVKLKNKPTKAAYANKRYLYARNKQNEDLFDLYIFTRVNNTSLDNFDWVKGIDSTATDAVIAAQIKAILLYYAAYFDALVAADGVAFSNDKVPLPLGFFNGAVTVKEFYKQQFIHFMGSNLNAVKAIALLKKAQAESGAVFEKNDNLLISYAAIMRDWAAAIK
jgi:hypothetical protein